MIAFSSLGSTFFLTAHLKSPATPERHSDTIHQLFPPPPPSTLPPCVLFMLQNTSDSHSNVCLTLTLYIILSPLVLFSQHPFSGHFICAFCAVQCQDTQMLMGLDPVNLTLPLVKPDQGLIGLAP